MKKNLLLLSAICLTLTACDSMTGTTNTPGQTHGTTVDSSNRADNTGRNVRDRNSQNMTADNQPENEVDRTITQKIRQAIMDDDSLSTNGKNVKIITINGVVTLRGPINNEREKSEIAKKARSINGVKSVDNQLEISSSTTSTRTGEFNPRSENVNR